MSDILFNRDGYNDLTFITNGKLLGSPENTLQQEIMNKLLEINIPELSHKTDNEVHDIYYNKLIDIDYLTKRYATEYISSLIVVNITSDLNTLERKVEINISIPDDNITYNETLDIRSGLIPAYISDISYYNTDIEKLYTPLTINEPTNVIVIPYNCQSNVMIITNEQFITNISPFNDTQNTNPEIDVSISPAEYYENELQYTDITIEQVTNNININELLLTNNMVNTDKLSYVKDYVELYHNNEKLDNAKYDYNNNIISFKQIDYAIFFPLVIRIFKVNAYATGVCVITTKDENSPYKLDCYEKSTIVLNRYLDPGEYVIIHSRIYPV